MYPVGPPYHFGTTFLSFHSVPEMGKTKENVGMIISYDNFLLLFKISLQTVALVPIKFTNSHNNF